MTQTAGTGTVPAVDYKQTVRTPKTDFPMRADASVREVEIQKFWEEQRIYERLAEENPGELFILHDGPPYANGDLHIGHALNKILKDIINRYQILQGRKVRYVPGWDCHGLPIELKVLQNLPKSERQTLSPLQLRRKARDFALATVENQRAGFRRYGVWGHWNEPYLTLQPEYEAAQLGVFGRMVLAGYIYRGLKPVHWSPSSQTALAEAELEYPTKDDGSPAHVSRSIYVRFPLIKIAKPETATVVAAELLPQLDSFIDREEELVDALLGDRDDLPAIGMAIWTTTPWTIPGNLAIALGPDLDYALVKSPTLGLLFVAKDLVGQLAATLGTTFEVLTVLKGHELEGSLFAHPLYHRTSPVVLGDHVTTESGTGAVHTAPGHGSDDYEVGLRYGLGILAPVDDYGRFTPEADAERKIVEPGFAGKAVLGSDKPELDGNGAVIAALATAGALLKEEAYTHKYPYDWRTKQPTIFRATTQWFASVSNFRDQALAQISEVQWVPASGENRITAMVAGRSDWCISRQRAWGLPIPAFYCLDCGGVLMSEQSLGAVQEAVRVQGSDIWWEKEAHELLPEGIRCPHCGGERFRKEKDIMDVWFDSGSSWAGVLQERSYLRFPADIYLEGSDQHRGWFQSSLLTCIATEGIAPYRSVITHGFTLDEQGRKMSKSLGNTVDPRIVIEGGPDKKKQPAYGADVLRLWVCSVDYTADMLIGPNILAQTGEDYRKIRNTARYLLGNLHDFDPERDRVAYARLEEIDRYLLHRLATVISEVNSAYRQYQFSRFSQMVQQFCAVDLSKFYLDIAKDRLYISAEASPRRRSCQTVLYYVLEALVRLVAPVLPHLAEDIWRYIPYAKPSVSVFEAGWPQAHSQWSQPELEGRWQKLVELRDRVNAMLESARNAKQIGASLEAKVQLVLSDPQLAAELESRADALRYLFIVSQVELVAATEPIEGGVAIQVLPADGSKCERCWNYSLRVGESSAHPKLCERCVAALSDAF